MYRLLVGADVSKDFFSASGLSTEGKECFSGTYEMNSHGFSEFLKALSSHAERLDQVFVAMESTGCYHINLFSFLSSQGIHTVVVNPLLIANFAKLSLRKTKTDKKDALTIARFLLDHHEEISQFSISQDHQDLRDLSRERESLCHLIAATKVEIKRVLRTIFPELESIGNLYSNVMLGFLQQHPSARLVRGAKRKAIAKALKGPRVGGKLTFSAEDLIKAAQSSVAVVSPAKEIIVQGKDCYPLTSSRAVGRGDKTSDRFMQSDKGRRLGNSPIDQGSRSKYCCPFSCRSGRGEEFYFF